MQVIAGSAKGRRLVSPSHSKGARIRPLSHQAKEALFNILANVVGDSTFLDLFAGSGQVGIEALSRGAKISIFIESDKGAISTIRKNLDLCGFSDRAEVYAVDAKRAVQILDKKAASFDIIFIGAPYGHKILSEVIELIANSCIIKQNGYIIAEHSKRQEVAEAAGKLVKFRANNYGDTVFSFYKVGTVAEEKN